MDLNKALLDTDVLSALMRKDTIVITKAKAYLAQYGHFTISIITRYEILRGLKIKRATQQIARFEQFCLRNKVLPITDSVVKQAADIYADLYVRGELISDADILIAASALANGYEVATNNEKHFERIIGLHVQNWLDK